MGPFAHRQCGYKLGTFLLFLATITETFVVIAPVWVQLGSASEDKSYAGLWWQCERLLANCSPWKMNFIRETHIAIMVLESSGLLCLLCATVFAIYVNWCSESPWGHRRLLEITIFMAVAPIVAGAVIFIYSFNYIYDFSGVEYGPAFILCCVSALTSFAAGMFIAIFNKPAPDKYVKFDLGKIPVNSFSSSPEKLFSY